MCLEVVKHTGTFPRRCLDILEIVRWASVVWVTGSCKSIFCWELFQPDPGHSCTMLPKEMCTAGGRRPAPGGGSFNMVLSRRAASSYLLCWILWTDCARSTFFPSQMVLDHNKHPADILVENVYLQFCRRMEPQLSGQFWFLCLQITLTQPVLEKEWTPPMGIVSKREYLFTAHLSSILALVCLNTPWGARWSFFVPCAGEL